MRPICFSGLIICHFFLTVDPCQSASAIVLQNGNVVIATEEHHLQLWKIGQEEPSWSVDIGGFSTGAQSYIADITALPNGDLLVVERAGSILVFSAQGEIKYRAKPVYEYLRMSVHFPDVEGSIFDYPVEDVARTGASYFSKDKKFVYLAGDQFSAARKVPVDFFFVSGIVPVTEILSIQFQDRNFIMNKRMPEWENDFKHWEYPGDASAIAVCNSIVIVGTKQGAVNFFPETLGSEGGKLRQVGDVNISPRGILEAGCIDDHLAFTVSFDTGNGQIQVWNLKDLSAVDTVSSEDDGHRGMAFTGSVSNSGKYLATVGDGDIRLWSVEPDGLDLISYHWIETKESQLFSIAPLGQDNFVYWDGKVIWELPSDGGLPIYYAGRKR